MDWFKHLTCSHEDPDISDAWDEFGDAAIVVFWTTLEIYGREFSHTANGKLIISVKYFERKLRRKWRKIEKILDFFNERSRIIYELSDNKLTITIPKFIEVASNWTKRKRTQPTEAPTEVTQEAPTAKDIEEDIEEERYIHTRIFDHWNNCHIVVHNKLTTKDRTAISAALKDRHEQEIINAISNYAKILKSSDYFFSYKWTLIDFLKRGLRKFANEADPFNNFKTDRNKAAPISEGNDDPKPMRTIEDLERSGLI